jgi:Right handed beta helix region
MLYAYYNPIGGIMRNVIVCLMLIIFCSIFADGGAKVESNNRISPQKYEIEDKDTSPKIDADAHQSQSPTETRNVITWGSVIHYLEKNIYIKKGEVLSILPGTKVIATGNYGIIVKPGGIIEASGSFEKPVIFAVDYDNDGNYGESSRGTSLEYWQGFKFEAKGDNSNRSVFRYCNFTQAMAKTSSSKTSTPAKIQKLFDVQGDCNILLENCNFSGNNYYGKDYIYIKHSIVEIRDCNFSNNNASLRFENSTLLIENTDFSNNQSFAINLYRVNTNIKGCNFLNNQNFNLLIREKNTITIENSNFQGNDSPVKPLFSINDLPKATFNGVVITDNSGLAMECNDTNMKMQRCQITSHSNSPALYFNSQKGNKRVSLINCNIMNNLADNSLCKIGNNIEMFIINSIVSENNLPEFSIAPNSKDNSLTVINSVISRYYSVQKDTGLKVKWENILSPLVLNNINNRQLIDQGLDTYSSGETEIFKYSPPEYIGIDPDIGYFEQ